MREAGFYVDEDAGNRFRTLSAQITGVGSLKTGVLFPLPKDDQWNTCFSGVSILLDRGEWDTVEPIRMRNCMVMYFRSLQ